MKFIKWISLFVLIIVLIITGILFVNFVKKRGEISIIQESKIKELYNIELYRRTQKNYENGKLVLSFHIIENGGYVVFDESQIKYCNTENVCNSSNYTYSKEKDSIYLETDNSFLRQGTYYIVVKDEFIELSTENGKVKTVYYFEKPKG